MARSETILRAFVASPDDVTDERGSLDEVISELTISLSKKLGVRLDLVGWDTHCVPGINTDPQANINEQINDEYDIFIGIMWKKFGTQTPRAGSGTAEEFERAYERYQKDQNSLKVMFYFKDDTPRSMSEIDPDQWASVNEFRRRLGEKGVLYWSFKDQEDFKTLVRMHLTIQLLGWGKDWGITKNVQPIASPKESDACDVNELEENEDEGFFDLIITGQENFENVTEIAKRMTNSIQLLGTKIDERSKEMEKSNTPTGTNIKMAKHAADHVAEDIESFVVRMNAEIPLFAKSYKAGINAFSRTVSLSTDFREVSQQELVSSLESIKTLNLSFNSSLEKINEFRGVVAKFPRITRNFNISKRHALHVLDSLINEMTNASNLTSELEKIFENTIEEKARSPN